MLRWAYYAGFVIMLAACRPKSTFEGKHDFPSRTWPSEQAVEFAFFIPDSLKSYNLHYTIRNNNNYEFQNIYLQYYLMDSTGLLLKKELNNLLLFNPVTGIPLGKGVGEIYTIQKKFLDGIRFDRPGNYRLRIDHYMRTDTLKGLASIGLLVIESGKDSR